MFRTKDKVMHKLSKDYMLVLEIGREQVKCRTKDHKEIWFYEWELKKINA